MNYKHFLLIILITFQLSCNNKSSNQEINNSNTTQNHFEDSETAPHEIETDKKESNIKIEEDAVEEEEYSKIDSDDSEEQIDNGKCKFKDDTYSATVNYYNPETGYKKTYTLDVEVEDCEVVQINFPKGGWLDEDHISPAELDEDGDVTIEGENGKTYKIHIDK